MSALKLPVTEPDAFQVATTPYDPEKPVLAPVDQVAVPAGPVQLLPVPLLMVHAVTTPLGYCTVQLPVHELALPQVNDGRVPVNE